MSYWSRQLEQDLDWRFGEIASLKVEAIKLPQKSTQRTALMRALWVMLYAHYEGFTKYAWDTYLTGIERSGALRKNLIEPLAILSLKGELQALKTQLSTSDAYQFCFREFSTLMSQPATFQIRYKKISNLPPDEYCRLCLDFGLPHAAATLHDVKMQLIVSRRHEIAHGQKLVSDALENFKDYETAAAEVMVELALAIDERLNTRLYLKVP